MSEELFSAARSEFKHMEYYYFHNFIYEHVWKNGARRHDELTPINDILNRYSKDYRVIFIGDASMSPYEIVSAGGSIEHWNEKPGRYWFEKLSAHFEKVVWLNPVPKDQWRYTQSIEICQHLTEGQMYPMTIEGLVDAMAYLSK